MHCIARSFVYIEYMVCLPMKASEYVDEENSIGA